MRDEPMDVNSPEAELWSENMKERYPMDELIWVVILFVVTPLVIWGIGCFIRYVLE